ncbi:hypothetical protein BC567DRAFT_229195 [Phyllosticta citribraziliensis]
MNRAPGKSDYWWARHESQCGGTYTKIAEPELNAKQLKALSAKARAGKQNNKIDSWVKQDSESADSKPKEASPEAGPAKVSKPKRRLSEGEDAPQKPKKIMLQCPICNALVTEKDVNEHLDSVHGT